MKKILGIIFILLTTITTQAADFTISVSGPAITKWKLKLGTDTIFQESKTKNLQNIYKHISNGNYINFDSNANKVNVKSRLVFESFDCTGTPHLTFATFPMLASNQGLYYASILNSFQSSKVLNSRREWNTPGCEQITTSYSNVWQLRSCTECNFGDDTVFTAVEE